MKIHNFIKDAKGMAQIEFNAKKERELYIANKNEQQFESKSGSSEDELPEKKGRKKKAQVEKEGV